MKLFAVDSIKRSLVKAVTFRAFILISDMVIIFAITHRFDFTLGVLIFSNLASTLLYLAHERAWNGIAWGRDKKPVV